MSAAPTSDTPILDSAVLPGKGKSFASMLYGVLIGTLFAMIIVLNAARGQDVHNPALGFIVIFYLASIALAVILHESAHLLAGWAVGLRFHSITHRSRISSN